MKDFLGSAKEASLENTKFVINPHRTNDGQDDEESWCWKLERWEYDEENYEWNLVEAKLY